MRSCKHDVTVEVSSLEEIALKEDTMVHKRYTATREGEIE